MQAKNPGPCSAVNSSSSSSGLLESLATHDWEVASWQDTHTLGMVIALRCSRCNLEWSSILSKTNTHGVS